MTSPTKRISGSEGSQSQPTYFSNSTERKEESRIVSNTVLETLSKRYTTLKFS